ncbi:hypothetical protein HDU86_001147 [Geranomyces michiganensis]|nr:hypothetical protein HDU86_001147 [Geranomyces michiganensis]
MSNQGYAPVSTPRKLKSKAQRAAGTDVSNLTLDTWPSTTKPPQVEAPSSLAFLQSIFQHLSLSLLESALSQADGNVERAVEDILTTHSDFDDASSTVSSGTEVTSSCATVDDEVSEYASSGSSSPAGSSVIHTTVNGLGHDDAVGILAAMFPLLSHKSIEQTLRTNANDVDAAANVLARASISGDCPRHDQDAALATLIDIFPDHDISALTRELARWDNVDSAIAALARPSPPPAFSCDGICILDGFPCILHAHEAKSSGTRGSRTPESSKISRGSPSATVKPPRSVTVLTAGRGASLSAARLAGGSSSPQSVQESAAAIQPRLSTLARPDDDYKQLREFAEEARRNRNDHYRRAATAFRKGDLTGRASAAFYAEEGREISKDVERWNNLAASVVIQRNTCVSLSYDLENALHQHDPYTIDLHELTVSEAVRYVSEAVNDWYSRDGASTRPRQPLKIITGAGRHSKHGIRKVYPAVIRWLKEGGWNTKPGAALVLLCNFSWGFRRQTLFERSSISRDANHKNWLPAVMISNYFTPLPKDCKPSALSPAPPPPPPSLSPATKRQRDATDPALELYDACEPPTKKAALSADAEDDAENIEARQNDDGQNAEAEAATLARIAANKAQALKRLAESKQLALERATMAADWYQAFLPEMRKPYFLAIKAVLDKELAAGKVIYPPLPDVYAFTKCPLANVKVVIIGQDPYHGPSQAHGLCFSVRKGVTPPPSLNNIFRELSSDIPSFSRPAHGDLSGWVTQGVLLLNASLTVRKGEANSHKGIGWSVFTDSIIKHLDAYGDGKVFMLWGAFAQKKGANLKKGKHLVLTAKHPSPLGANQGG